MTVIYADLLFLINLAANYLLLLCAGRVAGCPLRRSRIALGACVGALYAVLVFCPGFLWLVEWPYKVLVGVIMSMIAFGGGPRLGRVSIVFFIVSAALAGLVLSVELLGGTGILIQRGVYYSSFDIRLLLLLFAVCYFLMQLLLRGTGRHAQKEYAVINVRMGGRTVTLTALRDTGHTLADPVTNRTVVVADQRYFTAFLPAGVSLSDPIEVMKRCGEVGLKGVRLIPYRSVGVDCGVLVALRAEEVKVDGIVMGDMLVALSPNPVDDGGRYQALIGGDQI